MLPLSQRKIKAADITVGRNLRDILYGSNLVPPFLENMWTENPSCFVRKNGSGSFYVITLKQRPALEWE